MPFTVQASPWSGTADASASAGAAQEDNVWDSMEADEREMSPILVPLRLAPPPELGEALYVCYECGEACSTVQGWRAHMRTMHDQKADLLLWAGLYGKG